MSVLLSPREQRRPVLPWLALGIYLIYLFTSSGGFEAGDASLRYATARSWLAGQGGVLPRELGWDGGTVLPDGRVYSVYGPLQSILMVPFLLLARALPALPVPVDVVETFVICLGLFPLLSTGVVALVYLTLRELGRPPRIALLAALGLGLGSLLWHYARMGQEESLVAFGYALWLWGVARLAAGRPWAVALLAAGGSVALATRWATVPSLAILGTVSLVLLGRFRKQLALRDLALGTALTAATLTALLLYNHARFGDPLETGYGLWYEHAGYPMFELDGYGGHVAALLVSPYRGLFLFAPIVLAALAGTFRLRGGIERLLGVTAVAVLLTNLLFFASFRFWTGSHAWGPRFLVSTLVLLAPALAAFCARAPRTAAWVVAACALLQIFSTMQPASTEEYVWFNIDRADPGSCNEWRFACTAIPGRFSRSLQAVANTVANRPGRTLAERVPVHPAEVLSTSDYRTLYWWPVRIAFRLGRIPPWSALLLCAAGLGAGLAALRAAWRGAPAMSLGARP